MDPVDQEDLEDLEDLAAYNPLTPLQPPGQVMDVRNAVLDLLNHPISRLGKSCLISPVVDDNPVGIMRRERLLTT